jgi:hypothetical protein
MQQTTNVLQVQVTPNKGSMRTRRVPVRTVLHYSENIFPRVPVFAFQAVPLRSDSRVPNRFL